MNAQQRGNARAGLQAVLGLAIWTAIVIAVALWWWNRAFVHSQSFQVLSVQGSASFNGAPLTAAAGGAMLDGAEFVTGDNTMVNLRLDDGSLVQLASNSTLQVQEARISGDRRSYKTTLKLDAGEIIRKIPKPGDGLQRQSMLATPSVNIGVRGTEFAAAVAGTQTRAMTYTGVVALDPMSGKRKEMSENYGTVIEAGQAPQDPAVLLAAPAPMLPARGALLTEAAVSLQWEPVTGARGYTVELADDGPAFNSVVLRRSIEGPAMTLDALPHDANYYWRVSSIDERKLNGRGSEPRALHYKYHHESLRALAQASQAAEGFAFVDRALKGYASDSELFTDIGWLHYLSGDFAQARVQYDRALELSPRNPSALIQRGRTLFWLKELGAARADYDRALRITAQDGDALWGLAEVNLAENQLPVAEEQLSRVLAANPRHPYANFTMARLQLAKGSKAQARSYLERHLTISPDDQQALGLREQVK